VELAESGVEVNTKDLEFIGELLTCLELDEVRLMEWGFFDVSHTDVEIIQLFENHGTLGDGFKDLVSGSSGELFIDDLATAFRFRGILLFRKGQFDQAIVDLNNSISYNPKDQYTYFNRAECYKALGIKDKACEDYRKSADLGFMSAYPTIKEYCAE